MNQDNNNSNKNNKGILIAIIIVVVIVIIGIILLFALKPNNKNINDDNNNQLNNEIEENNISIKYEKISDYMFAIPSGFSTARSSNGTTITDNKVFILVTTSEYDNCNSFDDVITKTKDTLLQGIYSAFGVSAKNQSIASSEKIISNKGIEILKVNGEFLDYNSKSVKKYIAYYTIVDGVNGKYPIYWVGIPNESEDMSEVDKATKLIADNLKIAD